MTKSKSKYFIPVIIIILWIVYTLLNPDMSNYNTDEIWAYDIAADLNIWEIFKITHYEGHTFLWYLILKPFTYFPSLFPYIIKYLNWLFCLTSVIMFWKLAPIKDYVKIWIVFSSPFLVLYPSLERCYGLTLLLVVIIYRRKIYVPINSYQL